MRTYAPKGKTPEIKAPLSRDHLSSMSGIALSYICRFSTNRIKARMQQVFSSIFYVILMVCYGISYTSKPGSSSCQCGSRIHLEHLPAYASELNPDEGVWNYLKRVELKKVNCQDLDQLYRELRKAKERLRHKTEVIKSFFKKAGVWIETFGNVSIERV